MTPICNDVLTRVRQPSSFRFEDNVPCPCTYRVGDKGDKNGMPYTIKAFGANSEALMRMRKGEARVSLVWMLVKFKGDRSHAWDALLIGDTSCFREKIILGGLHPNPAFTHYWPKEWPQPV